MPPPAAMVSKDPSLNRVKDPLFYNTKESRKVTFVGIIFLKTKCTGSKVLVHPLELLFLWQVAFAQSENHCLFSYCWS